MTISTDDDDSSIPSSADFHVSMTNFILGANPVVMADGVDSPADDSEPLSSPTSEETSEAASGEETSEASDGEPQVVLIPVRDSSSESASESAMVQCEKKKRQSKKGSKKPEDCCKLLVCERKTIKGHAKCSGGLGKGQGSGSEDDTVTEDEEMISRAKQSKNKKKKNKPSSESDHSSANNASAATETTDDTTPAETSSEATTADSSPPAQRADTDDTSSDWTISEDALLRGMKVGGETWAEIANAMQRSKSDVKARWKVIEKQPQSDGEYEEREEKQTTEQKKDTGKSKKGEKGSKRQVETSKEDVTVKSKDEKRSDEGKAKQKNDGDDAAEPKKTNNPKSCKKQKKKEPPPPSSTSSSSTSIASSEEDIQQKAYLQSIRTMLYPPRLPLLPDAALSKTDCAVLASVDARRHAGRWLEMQANFYNATGRWVALHVIRDRCERAERERLRSVLGENGEGAKEKEELVDKVMRWMNGMEP